MSNLTVTVLVDNHTLIGHHYTGEHGLSLFIEQGKKKCLFDVGYSDLFLSNAYKMGIDLLHLDYLALSHGHIDHSGGLIPLMRRHMEAAIEKLPHRCPTVIAHPCCFYRRPASPLANIGAPVEKKELERHYHVKISQSPVWLTPYLVFLGEIPRDAGKMVPKIPKEWMIVTPDGMQPDPLLDDTALVFKSNTGLVIITGCSHSGVCNIIRYAQQVCSDERIRDVIGGFHLMGDDPAGIKRTVKEIKTLKPAALHPCHCTSLAAKCALAKVAPVYEVGVGLVMEY